MTISSLASRLGPARWSPYARPSDPGRVAGSSVPPGGTSRPSLRLAPATARLFGPARKEAAAAPSKSRFRAEAAACPKAPRSGWEKPKQKKNPKNPNPAEREEEEEEEPPVQESRDGGSGGFAFICTLAGHTEAISGISLPVGSDKLYSGSADGSVRVWDCNSGKCVDVIKMGGKIGCMITHGPWVFFGITKSVEAWNTQTGMKSSLHGPSGLVCSMTIKDDMLFAGTGDGRIMAREEIVMARLSGFGLAGGGEGSE